MLYINPFELIQVTDLTEIDGIRLRKEKRKLMLTFDLSEDQTISYKGVAISKDDVIKALEDLEFANLKQHHFSVYHCKPLFDFLTNGNIQFFKNYKDQDFFHDEDFLDFLKRFYIPKFDELYYHAFVNNDIDLMRNAFKFNLFQEETHFPKLFYRINFFLTDLIAKIESFENNIKINRYSTGDLRKFFDAQCPIDRINLLPSYFQNQRNAMATAIWDFAVALSQIQNTHHRAYILVNDYISRIIMTGNIKEQVSRYLSLNAENKGRLAHSEGGSSSGFPFYLIIILVIIVVRIATCNKSSNHRSNIIDIQHLIKLPKNTDSLLNLNLMKEIKVTAPVMPDCLKKINLKEIHLPKYPDSILKIHKAYKIDTTGLKNAIKRFLDIRDSMQKMNSNTILEKTYKTDNQNNDSNERK